VTPRADGQTGGKTAAERTRSPGRLLVVDPSRESLIELLELQKVDSRIDRLEHRLHNLPEAAELAGLEARRGELRSSIAEAQAVVGEHARRQTRLETEIDSIAAKIKLEDMRLYGGTVTNPRELSGLQAEIEALRRRQTTLEDEDLEVLEARESAEKHLRTLEDEASALDLSIEETTGRRDVAVASIEQDLQAARTERETWVPRFDTGLLGLYQKLRSSMLGGVAAAALLDGTCQGCHMRLPSQEYERVRDATGLVRCDECGRILVVLASDGPGSGRPVGAQ
jgi:predicted  nucleic acid-binding Zn-ribbon protein